jgi:hypothetical protein
MLKQTLPKEPIPETVSATLHYWDLSSSETLDEFSARVDSLVDTKAPVVFGTSPGSRGGDYQGAASSYNNKEVVLETSFLFYNQWNSRTPNARLFDFVCHRYHGLNTINYAHALELSEEAINARRSAYKCSFCGRLYRGIDSDLDPIEHEDTYFCSSCCGSRYLEDEKHFLLTLAPVKSNIGDNIDWVKAYWKERGIEPSSIFLPESIPSRKKQLDALKKKRIFDTKASFATRIYNLEKEAEIKIFIAEKGIDPFLAIVYHHTDPNCAVFGWNEKLSQKEWEKIQEKLKDAPFKIRHEKEGKK